MYYEECGDTNSPKCIFGMQFTHTRPWTCKLRTEGSESDPRSQPTMAPTAPLCCLIIRTGLGLKIAPGSWGRHTISSSWVRGVFVGLHTITFLLVQRTRTQTHQPTRRKPGTPDGLSKPK